MISAKPRKPDYFTTITLVPTYLVYLFANRFLRKHTLYRSNIPYDDWCCGATGLCQTMGIVISVGFWFMPFLFQFIDWQSVGLVFGLAWDIARQLIP